MKEKCDTNPKYKRIKTIHHSCISSGRSLQQNVINNHRDINLIFFRRLYALKIFSFYACLNLSYSSSWNGILLPFFSYSLKVTREMTLTDIFALALVTAKQREEVVWVIRTVILFNIYSNMYFEIFLSFVSIPAKMPVKFPVWTGMHCHHKQDGMFCFIS